MQIRVRWPIAARVCAAILAAILALQFLPGLLTPPDPAPLPPDVGLIGVDARARISQPKPSPGRIRRTTHRTRPASPRETRRHRPDRSGERRLGRVPSGAGVSRRAKSSEGRATAHAPHRPSARRRAKRKRGLRPRRQDPPAASPVPEVVTPPPALPASAPEAAPEAPPPAPPPPDDGSMEFAPR